MNLRVWSFLCLVVFSHSFAAPTQRIRIGNAAEPVTLDPQKVTGVPEDNLVTNLFEGLTALDDAGKIVPGMAARWEVSPDALVYTFHLRPDAVWSDGKPVVAGDFVYAWNRLLDPAVASEMAFYGYFIKNGRKVAKREMPKETLGAKALDDKTLQVTLELSTPYFLALLANAVMFPVPKQSTEKFRDRWIRPENIITNGPYLLAQWKDHQSILLKKNPHYWDQAKVKIEEGEFLPIESVDMEEKLFRTNALDVTNEIPVELTQKWRAKKDVFHSDPTIGSYYMIINVKKPPLNDARVRKALALSFDRTELNHKVLYDRNDPAYALVPPGTAGYQPKHFVPLGLEKLKEAQALLKAAGYSKTHPLPPFELLYNSDEAHRKVAEYLQYQWKTALGAQVVLVAKEWTTYNSSMTQKDYQMARRGWIGNYNDPMAFLENFTSDSAINATNFSNAKYDHLTKLAQREMDQKKRFSEMTDAEAILFKEFPLIPIYTYRRNYLKLPKVKGWTPNLQDKHPLKYVWIE